MKVVILCGGKGTRLGEYTQEIPKPLIEINRKPILWHLMKMYASYGFNDFILCLGYLGHKIEEYFRDSSEFNITFVNTGQESSKAERLMKVKHLIDSDKFFVAYGDDLSDVNFNELLKSHNNMDILATLTSIRPVSQFGIIEFSNEGLITQFKEKPILKQWINGGFFVFDKRIFDYFQHGWELEKEIFEKLALENKISAFKHEGFWHCMNTPKDAKVLNSMWEAGHVPWKTWED